MEKAYVLSSAIPELATNGKLAVYKTLDRRVSHLVIISGFDWVNRIKEECFRCPLCHAFVLPEEKKKKRGNGIYHTICPERKEQVHDGDNVCGAIS